MHEMVGTVPATGSSLATFSKGFDARLTRDATNLPWYDLANPQYNFVTLDGSLIKGRYYPVGDPVHPLGAWEFLFPDGRRAFFTQPFFAGKSTQELVNNYPFDGGSWCAANPNPAIMHTAPTEEFFGYYPTRIENRLGVGFTLHYDLTYKYLIRRISDDTDRAALAGTNADIHLDYTVIGGYPRYTEIRYPGARGGDPLKVKLGYKTQLFNCFTGTPREITLLESVEYPGGYRQDFDYFPSVDANDCDLRYATGRVKKITLPNGGIHEFLYTRYAELPPYSQFNDKLARVGISRHDLYTHAGATGTGKLTWLYTQNFAEGYVNNITNDPAGNMTRYRFYGTTINYLSYWRGLLIQTEYYQGTNVLKKRVTNTYEDKGFLPLPERGKNMQIVQTKTELFDDMVGGLPGTLIEENDEWDGWGRFRVKRTSGSLVPVQRLTRTRFAVDPSRVSGTLLVEQNSRWVGRAEYNYCSDGYGRDGVLNFYEGNPNNLLLSISGCAYQNAMLQSWLPSLPLSVDLQEWSGSAWVTKSRVESRYDAATGLTLRTIARKNPATQTDECGTALTPVSGAGEVVTDYYYDQRGNLALKKVSGGDDGSVFRSYSGTGDKPATADAPSAVAAIGSESSEMIYPFGIPASPFYVGSCVDNGTHCYFGFSRWSRAFTGAGYGGEAAAHQFIDSEVKTQDINPAAGSILKSFDANGLASVRSYDALTGRVISSRFVGDGTATDRAVVYEYLNDAATPPHLVGLSTKQEDADATQNVDTKDFNDGLGRKVLVRRLNPDGRYVWQAQHYDESGHVDMVGNWAASPPPWFNPDAPAIENFTDENLKNYILFYVTAFTRNCFRVYAPGSNGGVCERAGDSANDYGRYEFAGRVRRVERVASTGALISAVDNYYFGMNTRTVIRGVKTGESATEDAVTIHYNDGYGNLRVVDADAGVTSGQQGVDAIYQYDWGNRLVKVNLVPQATLTPTATDRYATSNGDNQVRSFVFDTYGRQIETNNPETGKTKYLRFNALGQVLEAEDENGRVGPDPVVGEFPPPTVAFPTEPPYCGSGGCYPNLQILGVFKGGGKVVAQWAAKGRINSVDKPPDQLYYRVRLEGEPFGPWTLGMVTLNREGVAAGDNKLYVEAGYTATTTAVRTAAERLFNETANSEAYTLVHQYDGRGRELAVSRKESGVTTDLRTFTYDAAPGTDCAAVRACGKMTEAFANPGKPSEVKNSYTFRASDGRMTDQSSVIPLTNSRPTYTMGFGYDSFGRQDRAYYPDQFGNPVADAIQLTFQHGGVKMVNRAPNAAAALLPGGAGYVNYADISRLGDYHPDGSLFSFIQGNGVYFFRTLDEAERVESLRYDNGVSCPSFPCPQFVSYWNSGRYRYDQAGNIISIGDDQFTHDRLARLKTAVINRHAHMLPTGDPSASGFVGLTYDYDMFGNIIRREKTSAQNYLVGKDDLAELFPSRDYTLGIELLTDNKIHAPGFLYDSNGNLASDGKKDFIYDELNQQIAVHEHQLGCTPGLFAASPHKKKLKSKDYPAFSAELACYGAGPIIETNVYGPDGMRVVREVGSKTSGKLRRTIFIRLGGNVVREFSEDYRTTGSAFPELAHEKSYIYGPIGLLATDETCHFNCNADQVEGLPTTRYYEYDHLGTIRAITKADGSLESTFDYEPFGLELKCDPASPEPCGNDASSNTHKFTGHERDEESGEDYMKARMYVLSTARFPQIDPLFGGAGNPQNWNPYIYVLNSPVGSSDPTGMAKVIRVPNSQGAIEPGQGGGGAAFDSTESTGAWGGTQSGTQSPPAAPIAADTKEEVKIVANNNVAGVTGASGAATLPVTPLAGTPGSPFQGPPAPPSANVIQVGAQDDITSTGGTGNYYAGAFFMMQQPGNDGSWAVREDVVNTDKSASNECTAATHGVKGINSTWGGKGNSPMDAKGRFTDILLSTFPTSPNGVGQSSCRVSARQTFYNAINQKIGSFIIGFEFNKSDQEDENGMIRGTAFRERAD